jgi:hypothetical protein
VIFIWSKNVSQNNERYMKRAFTAQYTFPASLIGFQTSESSRLVLFVTCIFVPMGCILLRGVHVNDVDNICLPALQLLYGYNHLSTHLMMANRGRNMLWEREKSIINTTVAKQINIYCLHHLHVFLSSDLLFFKQIYSRILIMSSTHSVARVRDRTIPT